ncbi:putative inactive serine/threonine-protein kinase slob1 [Heracleum sosnowskyi]|uniref:Inactive serine/threonine-protein kinase slob1 n=1 Tax=Heracleum sosnowskyi TaxID=360622 RepID=A0AAD8MMG7_9APIA|nr:putative inactive serine/threonine-protein kinase slob1 [Heracleum sosnowskyi]
MEKVKGSQKATVWDCGSSLYDSFELKSFERQLDSAISSARSLSMPHLTDTRRFPPPVSQHHRTYDDPPQILSKKSSKISRSFNKLMRTLFRTKQSPSTLFRVQSQRGHDRVYDRYGALTTIPEVSENANAGDGFSPEMRSAASSLVERSASERFAATSVGISCA